MVRASCCEKIGLKRGRWTAEEDELLLKYIQANGEGSWRSLPKNAGLLRCGKSCRLRWTNYLRPNLKKSKFTSEEHETIVKLQCSLGNRVLQCGMEIQENLIEQLKSVQIISRFTSLFLVHGEEMGMDSSGEMLDKSMDLMNLNNLLITFLDLSHLIMSCSSFNLYHHISCCTRMLLVYIKMMLPNSASASADVPQQVLLNLVHDHKLGIGAAPMD